MKPWKHKINIKQYLSEDESWEGITTAANAIAKELRRLPEELLEGRFSVEDAIMFLEEVYVTDCKVYDNEQELLDEVNDCLNVIYDFADNERILLG